MSYPHHLISQSLDEAVVLMGFGISFLSEVTDLLFMKWDQNWKMSAVVELQFKRNRSDLCSLIALTPPYILNNRYALINKFIVA